MPKASIDRHCRSTLTSTLREKEATRLAVGQMNITTRALQSDSSRSCWERTRFIHPIDARNQQSIDIGHQQSIDNNVATSIDNRPIPKTIVSEKDKLDNQYITPDEFGIFRDLDGYAKATDGRTLHVSREDIADILQTANGADNLFMHQRSNPEQKATKECYDTTGGIDNGFIQQSRHTTHHRSTKFYWEEKDEYGVYRDDRRYARDLDGRTIPVHTKDIRRLLESASRDEPAYICLPEHASSFTQTKLVPEIYTKDEINEMFYGEMKQDIAIIQPATDVARPPSIDKRQPPSIGIRPPTSIDRHHDTSIDNRLTASIDNSPPHPHTMKSQLDFHTREEIDQLVVGIYRALETREERLDGRCDDIYFSMDFIISALTSKVETIQGELVKIQSYIACQPEASLSIDRHNNISTDIHNRTSVDNATNRGRLVPKMTSDMSNTHYHGEEISADTYAALTRHQFNLESLAIQGELVKIQSYIARRPEASLLIDRRNNISTNIHNQTSVDNATNRGRLVPKMTSDMSNTHYHGEEISADTYAALTRHQFNLESFGERLHRIENTTATMKDK
ncbi:hypothetical protein DY000_02006496 [Brassica cretica]|uniref:Uncharacterized protein n=1 Tax=Brassica cretica TaxID=69181 RepID=A0ABQ7C331_BRACR|nr:hypothetical protein DY000_02006496 [Brassica cretica]